MKAALVVTTIQAPNDVMRALAQDARRAGAPFIVMGDRKSPPEYVLEGAQYYSLAEQHRTFGGFSEQLPVGHYVRKNLGYLAALDTGCDWVLETDDDNYPLAGFLDVPPAALRVRHLRSSQRWVNVYRHFGPSAEVWPRGFPLEALRADETAGITQEPSEQAPVLVQGLANENPDVDAVYRLTRPLPVNFDAGATPLSLAPGNWCPFNSQNTWFRRDIAVLLYLPSHCSFRMTDIWRSFVAQRCLWARKERLVFVTSTVRQERNEHNLLRDFSDEVPGYLKNDRIAAILEACTLTGSPGADLMTCYEALVRESILPAEELLLARAWVDAVEKRA